MSKQMKLVETYRGIDINKDEEGKLHLGFTFTGYDHIEDCKTEVDRIKMKWTLRKAINPDLDYTFDDQRGDCVVIDGEVYPVGEVSMDDKELAGLEYYRVNNPYVTEDDDYLTFRFKSFIGRIADAIRAIREGYGDALQTANGLFTTESVVRFINRERGEEIRKKTIEGWTNATFSWIVKWNNGNGEWFVGEDKNVISTFLYDGVRQPAEFETREEAKRFIAELEDDIKKFDVYKEDKEKQQAWIQSLTDKDFNSVALRAFLASLDLEEGVEGSGYDFTVEQWLHRNPDDEEFNDEDDT